MAWGERERRPHTRHAQTAFATYLEQSRHQMLRQRRDSWMLPQKTSPLFLYICPTKKPSLDRQLDRITAYQGSVLWSKFSDRCLPSTTASYILSRNSPRGLFLDSIYRTTTIPLTWFLFFGCIFSCLCLQVWCWHFKRLLCISCRCRFFLALFAISVFMLNVHVMLLSTIRSIFLLWILRFSGLKVIAPPGGYSWI